jgi:hypothetical protein
MKKLTFASLCLLLALATFTTVAAQKQSQGRSVPKPEEFFGFMPGSDYMLFNYEQLSE